MQKSNIKPIYNITFFMLLIIFIATASGLFVRQAILIQRHHLLCEILKPGMSVDEVIEKLHQAGEFSMSRAEWSDGDIELGINYIDIKGNILYGHFALRFFDYKYAQAYIMRFDVYDFICDFTQATPSTTSTP